MKVTIFDMILLLIAVIVIIRVSFKGFIAEFFSMAAFLLAIITAFRFYRNFATLIHISELSPTAAYLIAFFTLFILVFLAVKFMQMLTAAVFQHEILCSLDHALGFFLGVFEAYVIILIVLTILELQPFINLDDLFTRSVVVQMLTPLPVNSSYLLQVIHSAQ